MPASNSSPIVHYWAGRFPGKVGWLLGPSYISKSKLRKWVPFALDNDAFSSWTNGTTWDESAYWAMMERVSKQPLKPMWAAVPDVVANKEATLEKWNEFAPKVSQFGWPLAAVMQDGMTPDDIPKDASVVFIGGTDEWKWSNIAPFCEAFPRVHVGRVNTVDRLWLCHDAGVESVDGTGWHRDGTDAHRFTRIQDFLEGKRSPVKPKIVGYTQTILELC